LRKRLLSGAYRTGETTRAAFFVYPFIMISVGYGMDRELEDGSGYGLLAALVFVQTLLMQLAADYDW
jgi:hypothetical protein